MIFVDSNIPMYLIGVHIAVMLHRKISKIMTFDTAFQKFPGISIIS